MKILSLAATLTALQATGAQAAPATVQDYMTQPRVVADHRISYGKDPSQVIDLFLPKGPGPHPVVILIHGGCYLSQYEGLAQISGIAADLTRRGYAVWNVEYRKLGEPGAGYPGTFLDVATAVDRIPVEAARYHLNPKRVVAVGHSAGGHLALWAAARGRLATSSPLWRARPLRISSTVSLGGIGDLKRQGQVFGGACGPEALPQIIGADVRRDPYADTSPAELLPTGARTIMISGDLDHVMPPPTGRDYVGRVKAASDFGEAIAIANASHFDVVIPGTPAWRIVADVVAREIARLR